MSYGGARSGIGEHRSMRIAVLLGERAGHWFTDLWGSVQDMLESFSSDKENQEIASGYATSASMARPGPNLRLDYVCALRREVRKQYVSGDSDLCTDVTPFRHGAMSAHGAQMFDGLMHSVMQYSERQAKGGAQ